LCKGGDARKPADNVDIATLGAVLRRDEKAGGYVVEHIYAHDPDLPEPGAAAGSARVAVKEGEVIVSIDGQSVLSVGDERELLRGKAGQQVMLHVKPATGDARDVLVKPISAATTNRMRYAEWEYTRRQRSMTASNKQIGYVHLQAMGPNDIDQWARDYYPVFDRQGLIIDVRHNHGGNIDSWLLSDLLRKAWFYWQPRVGNPSWNMQYAFRGHIVVLCDQETASDGEAFTEGFKHFEMGKVIGTRTWGGEIWLSGSNTQADNGVATAAETGVYSNRRQVADRRPRRRSGHHCRQPAARDFSGDDAQLQAAIDLLKQEIKDDPAARAAASRRIRTSRSSILRQHGQRPIVQHHVRRHPQPLRLFPAPLPDARRQRLASPSAEDRIARGCLSLQHRRQASHRRHLAEGIALPRSHSWAFLLAPARAPPPNSFTIPSLISSSNGRPARTSLPASVSRSLRNRSTCPSFSNSASSISISCACTIAPSSASYSSRLIRPTRSRFFCTVPAALYSTPRSSSTMRCTIAISAADAWRNSRSTAPPGSHTSHTPQGWLASSTSPKCRTSAHIRHSLCSVNRSTLAIALPDTAPALYKSSSSPCRRPSHCRQNPRARRHESPASQAPCQTPPRQASSLAQILHARAAHLPGTKNLLQMLHRRIVAIQKKSCVRWSA
jgi:hypothetical protein